MSLNIKLIILMICLVAMVGCSKLPTLDSVLSDKRTAYRKSRDLPNLEVPPDLTTTRNEALIIPGEDEATSLTEFERQRAQNTNTGSGVVLGKGEFEGEQWIALQGEVAQIWPELRKFWLDEGYQLDLDDPELGVMETHWKAGNVTREKFMIFGESSDAGGTILFVSSEAQDLSEGEWLGTVSNVERDKEIIRELNLLFYGSAIADNSSADSSTASPTATATPGKPRAEVRGVGDGTPYLAIPAEYTRAWHETKQVLERAGYAIQSSNADKGTYDILYFKPQAKKKKGLLSRLKFWGDDDDDGKIYQLSLTGVGDKTEIIIMDAEGERVVGEDSTTILENLRGIYNQR